MDEHVMQASANDTLTIKRLWEYCFDDTSRFVEFYFQYKYCADQTLVLKHHQDILCTLQLNPYTMIGNDSSCQISYIVGISTPPEKRGKGYMRHLLPYALSHLNEKGQSIAIMMAIDSRLYTSYGFAFIANHAIYDLPIRYCKTQRTVYTIQQATVKDIKALTRLYAQQMQHKNHYIDRDEAYFRLLFKEISSEDGYCFIISHDQQPRGYLIYFLEDQRMLVRELMYQDRTALDTALHFIYQHNTQQQYVRFHMPCDDPLQYLWPNLKEIVCQTQPFMMARIINLKGYLEGYQTKLNHAQFTIKVIDSYLSCNRGTFLFQVENHHLHLLKTERAPQITITIGPLTQWSSGYLSFGELLKLNLVEVHDDKILPVLDQLFEHRCNYFNDYV